MQSGLDLVGAAAFALPLAQTGQAEIIRNLGAGQLPEPAIYALTGVALVVLGLAMRSRTS